MNEVVRLETNEEEERLAALRRYKILDTEPEEEFDEIVRLVRSIFNISHAAINLIDSDRQWSLSSVSERMVPRRSCARSEAFCDYTIRGEDVMMVDDATKDPRFAQNRFVTGPLGVRSYLGVPLSTPDGYKIGALCVFGTEPRNFTEADREVLNNLAKVVMSQFELRLTVRTDGLTGVLTRRAFMARLERVVAENSDSPNTLVLVDLDHFKSINDQFGHPAGDIVLTRVASAMWDQTRKSDSVGRLGGEEFGILLQGASLARGQEIISRLQDRVTELSIAEIKGRTVTISAGIAERCPAERCQSWVERTDRALYAAKRSGRNRIVVATTAESS